MLRRRLSRRGFLAGVAAVTAYAAFGANKCATLATLALRNARLWDGTGAPPADGMTVAVLRDTIIAVGRDGEVELGRDTQVIDCAGAFVMPGVIDTHCHVTLTLVAREPLVNSWLRAGVTTIRDTGTIRQGPFLIRDLAKELGPSPRIIAAGPAITVPGGYPITRGPQIGEPISYPIASAEEAAPAVYTILDTGADFIKIAVETGYPNGHLLEDGGSPTLSLAEVRAIVAAAHARGVGVSAHVSNAAELNVALDGGVDSMAHTPLDAVSDKTLRAMVARGVTMTSTLNIWGTTDLTAAKRNISQFVRLGGRLSMGTDYPFQTQPGMPIDELFQIFSAGLTEQEVLLASTRDAALVCRRNDLGTVELGKRADLLVLDGDPLTDLAAMLQVRRVLQDGAVIV